MALLMKLPNVIINKGKFVYRRRIPTDLRDLYPKTFFQTRFRIQQSGADLVSEHSALQTGFERMVQDARSGSPEAIGVAGIRRYIEDAWDTIDDPRTERERCDEMRVEAESLVQSIRIARDFEGDGGDSERREIAAEEIERIGGSPLLYLAVTQPEATPPPVTLADASNIYAKEHLGEKPSKSARNTFNRIKRRLETSLGPLDRVALVDLKREHARKVRDDLHATRRNGGGTLSSASVQREINSIKAMISVGIVENDL